jgi:hypothetical protein
LLGSERAPLPRRQEGRLLALPLEKYDVVGETSSQRAEVVEDGLAEVE